MIRWFALALSLTLMACAPGETERRASPALELPPMRTFATPMPSQPRQSNAVIARDFLELAFRLENGDRLAVFSRFEGPVTVAVLGKQPPTLGPDLDRLLQRLRKEAGIDISRTARARDANIVIEVVTSAQIKDVAPSAACFVRPNVSDWSDYRARRNDRRTYWTGLSARQRMAIFLPRDVAPQEVRDCLHEEIAQALGPVNDLYRLSESVFNDDNFSSVLTGHDMLILKTHYDPALRTGMREREVAARLPDILARLNPAGGRSGIAPPIRRDGQWHTEIAKATAVRSSKARRRLAAERAVNLAAAEGASAARLALSYYWLGRLSLTTSPERAVSAFLTAQQLYRRIPGADLPQAYVALQLAAFQLSGGSADRAISLVDASLPAARRGEHAALLSLLLLVKAEALEVKGERRQAQRIQRDALAWARYGFGKDENVRDRAAEILSISPRSREPGGAV